jgi:putative oxidoreductase
MNTPSLAVRGRRFRASARNAIELVDRWPTPLFDLAIRLYVASVFFRAGWLKISNWETTLLLFQNDYHVPFLSPTLAAVMGTGGELLLPVLLAFGLAGRFGAVGLFVMNLVAATSFPEISELGLQDHWLWAVLLATTVLHGPGKFSIDHWKQWPE